MTGFEIYLEQNGFRLIYGNRGPLNTYYNCGRVWEREGKTIWIGLYAQPTRVGIIDPYYENFEAIPSENDYERYLKMLV